MTGRSDPDVVRIAAAASEVTNYAPQFVAQAMGFFEAEGLQVESTTVGGPGVVGDLVSGASDVAVCGAWRLLAYRRYVDADLRAFATLTARCPVYLIARDRATDFSWSDLHGRTVVLGPVAPPPTLILRSVMRREGAEFSQVKVIPVLAPNEAEALFRGGLGDYYFAMPPLSEVLVADGFHQAASLADVGGPVPWSVYIAKQGFLKGDRAERFVRAVARGVDWLLEHDPSEAPEVLDRYFGGVSQETATLALRSARDQGIWTRGAQIDRASFQRWQELAAEYGLIDEAMPFDDVVDANIASAASVGLE